MSTVTTIKRGGLTAAIDSMGAQLTSLALQRQRVSVAGRPCLLGQARAHPVPHCGLAAQQHGNVCSRHLRDAAPRTRTYRRAQAGRGFGDGSSVTY